MKKINSMKIKLRDDQKECIQKIIESLKKGKKRVMIVGPPGSGKGTLIGYLAARSAAKGNRSLFVVHKKELVEQTAERTIKQFGCQDVGFYLAGKPKRQMPVMFASIQTITRRRFSSNFKSLMIDECHRIRTDSYQKFLKAYWAKNNQSILLGWTATPFRTDKKGFESDFDDMIQMATYQELVGKKYLVPTRVIAPEVTPDLRSLKMKGSYDNRDFVDKEMFDAYDDERVYRGIVDLWIKHGEGRKTILFTVNSKEHCRKMEMYFKQAGIKAVSITSDTSDEQRSRLLSEFKLGLHDVLINIGLFTEGLSIDDVSCIVLPSVIQ